MKQQTVGYEVRVYAGKQVIDVEMFRSEIDARTWAAMRNRQAGNVTVTLHRIGRGTDGLLYQHS